MPFWLEPCGSWQLVQLAEATGYPRCALVKRVAPGSWQLTHSLGTSRLRRCAAFSEPCGSWQTEHPSRVSGRCLTVAFAAPSAIAWWQEAHSSRGGLTRF